VFVAVPDGKTVKNRLHLDIRRSAGTTTPTCGGCASSGPGRSDIGQATVPWTVLADPQADGFCLVGLLAGSG
jgi:hypothetical protein